jgi:uncharacterized small protein (DUF1192 family)
MAVMVAGTAWVVDCVTGVTSLILRASMVRAQIVRNEGAGKGGSDMDEPAEVRIGRGQRLMEAVREDLDLFGTEELEERIGVLRAEIARVEAQLERKHATRAAADALFGAPPG